MFEKVKKRRAEKKAAVYQRLRDDMLDYTDYADKLVLENGEPLIPVPKESNLIGTQYRSEMLPYTGDGVYVRKNVVRKLAIAARYLTSQNDKLQLEVCYGYRAPEIQRANFEREKAKLADEYEGDELMAATHTRVAIPEVAGHPTGGAVDVRILKDGKPLNFGTNIWDFVEDSYRFSPYISRRAKRNRKLLDAAMLSAEFAPYDGEWWHYSYGDKEWAGYYSKPNAIYSQVEFRTTNNLPE